MLRRRFAQNGADLKLLEQSIRTSGLSARRFAEEIVTRDERTVRRWLAGDTAIPAVVVRRLTRYMAKTISR